MEGVTVTLDKKELVFLAALLDETVILGVEDPFLGWLAEQVEDEWKRSSAEMLRRGLISKGDDGGYEVSAEIAYFVRLCCSPDIWVSVNFAKQKQERSPFVLNLSIVDKKAVKISPGKEDNNLEFCYGIYEREESMEICNALGISNNIKAGNGGFNIPERAFKQISAAPAEEGLVKLKDILQDDKLEAECFIKALKDPQAKSLINIGSMKADSSGMISFVLIEGDNCLWMVTYHDNKGYPEVSVRQSDLADCMDKLHSYIKKMK